MEERGNIEQAVHCGQDHRSQYGLRQVFQQPGEEEQTQRERHRGEHKRERAEGARPVVHIRLRQPTCDGIAVPQRGREICCSDAEKLLPGVQGISVLCGEGAGGGDAFDIGE